MANFPSLLPATITFPLSRLAHHPASGYDGPSAALWTSKYPSIPYQVLTYTLSGTPKWHPTAPLSIHGYRCGAFACASPRPPKTHTIPAPLWAGHRLALSILPCPSCSAVFTQLVPFPGRTYFEHCLAAFGVPVFDLWWTPLRQFGPHGFVDTVLGLVDAGTPAMQARYVKFLGLMRGLVAGEGGVLVPTVDIDLVWHTHQLAPGGYAEYCGRWVGRSVFHDDSVAVGERGRGLLDTQERWAREYGEAMLAPGDEGRRQMIGETKGVWERRKGERERRLWEFDVDEGRVALKKRVDEADKEWREALGELDVLSAELRRLGHAVSAYSYEVNIVKPIVKVGKKAWYSKSSKQKLKGIEDRKVVNMKLAGGLQDEVDKRTRKMFELMKVKEVHDAEWTGNQKARDRLEAELKAAIAAAEEDFSQAAADEKLFADPAVGPAHAVIGTEAHMETPVLGKHRFWRNEPTWMETWRTARRAFPLVQRQRHITFSNDYSGGWVGVPGGYGGLDV